MLIKSDDIQMKIPETKSGPDELGTKTSIEFSNKCPATVTPKKAHGPNLNAKELIEKTAHDFQLNKKQTIAFHIISDNFIERQIFKQNLEKEPLQMMMTGPGGTGKTCVIETVHKVMEYYNCAHKT